MIGEVKKRSHVFILKVMENLLF